jgi:Arc/MetJ-type ribon-helix-helix transcriptional regulator
MPINVMATLRRALRQLEAERGRIDRQIAALQTALGGTADSTGRGRSSSRPRTRTRRRRRMSAAARRALSQRMKAYWAKRRAGTSKSKAKGGR